MSANCKWCGLRPATQDDYNSLKEGDDGNLCWREWNPYTECFEIEERKKEAAPDLLEALEAIVQSGIIQDAGSAAYWIEDKINAALAKAKGGN